MPKEFQYNLLDTPEVNERRLREHEEQQISLLPTSKLQERFEGTPELTQREFEIMQLILKGVEIPDIAITVGITVAGIKWRLSNIYYKFNVENRLQLIEKSATEGLHFFTESGIKHSFSTDINLQGHLKLKDE